MTKIYDHGHGILEKEKNDNTSVLEVPKKSVRKLRSSDPIEAWAREMLVEFERKCGPDYRSCMVMTAVDGSSMRLNYDKETHLFTFEIVDGPDSMKYFNECPVENGYDRNISSYTPNWLKGVPTHTIEIA